MFNSTTFSSSRRRLQRANPSGAGEQVRAINLASAAPSKIRGRAEFGLYLRFSVASNPSSTSCCRVRETVSMLVSSAAEIALSLHPSPPSDTSAFSRMRALVSSCAELLPARINASSRSRSSMVNFTTYFLPAISFPATNHLHRCIAATEIQRNTPDSRTRATSIHPRRRNLAGEAEEQTDPPRLPARRAALHAGTRHHHDGRAAPGRSPRRHRLGTDAARAGRCEGFDDPAATGGAVELVQASCETRGGEPQSRR